MKNPMFDVRAMFPKASESFLSCNSGTLTHTGAKNTLHAPPNAKKCHYEVNHQRKIQDSKPQHHQTPALDGSEKGKTPRNPRIIVRFIGYRARPLDPDNFAGGCKDLLDGLRHAGLIPGDEPWRISLETRQEKVKSYKDEKTVIEIEF